MKDETTLTNNKDSVGYEIDFKKIVYDTSEKERTDLFGGGLVKINILSHLACVSSCISNINLD